jgi:hypothetical protein
LLGEASTEPDFDFVTVKLCLVLYPVVAAEEAAVASAAAVLSDVFEPVGWLAAALAPGLSAAATESGSSRLSGAGAVVAGADDAR